jgi:hypothetical protein
MTRQAACYASLGDRRTATTTTRGNERAEKREPRMSDRHRACRGERVACADSY